MESAKRRPDAVRAADAKYGSSDKCKAKRKERREGPAREKILEQKRRWGALHRDEINAKRRAERKANENQERTRRAVDRELNGDWKNERDRNWRATHREHLQAYQRQRSFGLSPEQFAAMLDEQNDLCAVCHVHMESRGELLPTGRKRTGICVDHDHVTGKVRGLLCSNCNKALGLFHDDPVALEAAAAYLRR